MRLTTRAENVETIPIMSSQMILNSSRQFIYNQKGSDLVSTVSSTGSNKEPCLTENNACVQSLCINNRPDLAVPWTLQKVMHVTRSIAVPMVELGKGKRLQLSHPSTLPHFNFIHLLHLSLNKRGVCRGDLCFTSGLYRAWHHRNPSRPKQGLLW